MVSLAIARFWMGFEQEIFLNGTLRRAVSPSVSRDELSSLQFLMIYSSFGAISLNHASAALRAAVVASFPTTKASIHCQGLPS